MELRLAAHPEKDAAVVAKAKATGDSQLYQGTSLVAKWVPATDKEAVEFSRNEHLVSRENDKGQVELLVLVGPNDVTEKHIRAITTGTDAQGRLALDGQLDDLGATKLRNLTRENVSTNTCKRYLALIVGGRVVGAPEIMCMVGRFFQVTGDFTPSMIGELAEKIGSKFKTRDSVEPPLIVITPARIIAFIISIVVLILACVSAEGLKPSRHARLWLVFGAIVGAAIGGYWFGVSWSAGAPYPQSDIPPWGELLEVEILRFVIGAAAGAASGALGGYAARYVVRRAIYNAVRVLRSIRRPRIASASPGGRSVRKKGALSNLNQKQKVVLWIGLLAIVVLSAFPPWIGSRARIITESNPRGYGYDYRFIGFHHWFSSQELTLDTCCIITKVDYRLLVVLLVGAAALTGLMVYLLRSGQAKLADGG
jgi:hypothetical protein